MSTSPRDHDSVYLNALQAYCKEKMLFPIVANKLLLLLIGSTAAYGNNTAMATRIYEVAQ